MNKTTLKRAASLFATCFSTIVLLSESLAGASGLTQDQLNVFNEGIPYFNTEINSCTGQAASVGSSVLTGADNVEKAYNFFISKGLAPVQAAGIVGNFWWESHGVNPAIEQTPGAWSDMTNDFDHAVGIAQWDGGRRVKIINDASSSNKSVKDLAFQLDYSWTEINENYASMLKNLKATTNATDATMVFGRGYEAPAEATAAWDKRIGEAIVIVAKYSGGTSSLGSSCSVSCDPNGSTVASNLSQVRQTVVCVAQRELTSVWTPLPVVPRLQYTKYTEGWMCDGGASPNGNHCPYDRFGNELDEFWCADFASWVYKQAGYSFVSAGSNKVIDGWRYPAVKEIDDMGNADQNFHWHAAAGYTPVPGDLAIHATLHPPDKTHPKAYFVDSHVNIVVDVTGGQIQFIGGDQGSGPWGGPASASVVSLAKASSPIGSPSDRIISYVSPD